MSSFHSSPTQFECCGIDNATDWVRLNPEAVIANNGVPPADCFCELFDDDDCSLYSVVNNGTLFTFTAWSDVYTAMS